MPPSRRQGAADGVGLVGDDFQKSAGPGRRHPPSLFPIAQHRHAHPKQGGEFLLGHAHRLAQGAGIDGGRKADAIILRHGIAPRKGQRLTGAFDQLRSGAGHEWNLRGRSKPPSWRRRKRWQAPGEDHGRGTDGRWGARSGNARGAGARGERRTGTEGLRAAA